MRFGDKSKTPEISKLLALLRTPDLITQQPAPRTLINQPTPEGGLEPTADWTSNFEAHQQPKHHHHDRLLPVNHLTPEIETKHRAPNTSPPKPNHHQPLLRNFCCTLASTIETFSPSPFHHQVPRLCLHMRSSNSRLINYQRSDTHYRFFHRLQLPE